MFEMLNLSNPVYAVIVTYFACLNLAGLISMAMDKRKAIKKSWRIPEATLFTIALFGGSLGSTLGMFLFRHKTKHWYFLYGMPLILLIQIGILFFLAHSQINVLTM